MAQISVGPSDLLKPSLCSGPLYVMVTGIHRPDCPTEIGKDRVFIHQDDLRRSIPVDDTRAMHFA